MGTEGTSRRSILGLGALGLGALAGAIGLGGAVDRIQSGQPLLGARGAKLVLHGSDWHLFGADLKRGQLPGRGDRVSVHGVLSGGAGGSALGEFHATQIHLDAPLGVGGRAGAVMEMHNFNLADGTLVGMGTAAPGAGGVFTILGGSGRYLGATGSYLAEQNPVETGGDGSARFTLTLITREGQHGR